MWKHVTVGLLRRALLQGKCPSHRESQPGWGAMGSGGCLCGAASCSIQPFSQTTPGTWSSCTASSSQSTAGPAQAGTGDSNNGHCRVAKCFQMTLKCIFSFSEIACCLVSPKKHRAFFTSQGHSCACVQEGNICGGEQVQ